MNLVERAQGIILKPKDTWPTIAAEPETTQGLYTNYIMPLAVIGPIATFIGMSLIGVSTILGTVRTSVVGGLVQALISYALALVGCYVTAFIAAQLAPSFGGEKNVVSGLKLAAYSSTPVWIASIILILPQLAIVVLLAGLYGLYILYLGVPPVMKVPPDKQVVFTLILVVVSVVLFMVIGAVVAALRIGAGGLGVM